jgi:hypothetical protein
MKPGPRRSSAYMNIMKVTAHDGSSNRCCRCVYARFDPRYRLNSSAVRGSTVDD